MSGEIQITDIPANSKDELELFDKAIERMNKQDPIEIPTKSFIHAGLYCRTCLVPKGGVIAGALIKIPTVLFVSGDCTFTAGNETVHLKGTRIFRASPGRRQFFVAHEDTLISMSFATEAKTLNECEREFTDEYEQLISKGE